jgi:putative ABC transport system permease protein
MDIILLLNSNFLILNLIAFVVAIPAVILFMNHWLQNFSFKTNLNWWVFVLAGLATSAIVLATVSLQSWRAANGNPVEAIKSE